MVPAGSPRPGGGWTLGGWTPGEGVCWPLLLPALLLLAARPAAFPTSLSDCQTPTGWNCSGESRPGRAPSPLLPGPGPGPAGQERIGVRGGDWGRGRGQGGEQGVGTPVLALDCGRRGRGHP